MPIKKGYTYQKYDLNHISWEVPEHRILEQQSKMSDLVRAKWQKEQGYMAKNN